MNRWPLNEVLVLQQQIARPTKKVLNFVNIFLVTTYLLTKANKSVKFFVFVEFLLGNQPQATSMRVQPDSYRVMKPVV